MHNQANLTQLLKTNLVLYVQLLVLYIWSNSLRHYKTLAYIIKNIKGHAKIKMVVVMAYNFINANPIQKGNDCQVPT